MQLYLDTASLDEIREAARLGIISGVTTNPTLMMKAGRSDYRAVTQEICSIVQGPISAEVISQQAEGMIEEAKQIAQWSPHVVVKVPLTAEGLRTMSVLSETEVDADAMCQDCAWQDGCESLEVAHDLALFHGIRTNATLVFSVNQGLLAARAGAHFVSPFVGRLDDTGQDGMQVVADLAKVFKTYDLSAEIIAASIRHPLHITQAALAGAHIATVPHAVLIKAIKHPLTDIGLERFSSDWAKVSQ